MSQKKHLLSSQEKKVTLPNLNAIVSFSALGLTFACEDALEDPDSRLEDSSEPEFRFGFRAKESIKNWSALLHMSKMGSIEFCIENRAWHAEDDDCCKGLKFMVRVIGEPPICSDKSRPTRTRISDGRIGAGGR